MSLDHLSCSTVCVFWQHSLWKIHLTWFDDRMEALLTHGSQKETNPGALCSPSFSRDCAITSPQVGHKASLFLKMPVLTLLRDCGSSLSAQRSLLLEEKITGASILPNMSPFYPGLGFYVSKSSLWLLYSYSAVRRLFWVKGSWWPLSQERLMKQKGHWYIHNLT